jgi:hypothetical protein
MRNSLALNRDTPYQRRFKHGCQAVAKYIFPAIFILYRFGMKFKIPQVS